MPWEYEIWLDDRFVDAGETLSDLERPVGSRCILDASMVEAGEVGAALEAALDNGVQGLLLSGATDDHAEAMARIVTLESLDLTHSPVTDKVLGPVARLEKLRSLALRATGVKGPGLEALLPRTGLQSLDLTSTALQGEVLQVLGRLSGLRELWLDSTGVPGDALEQLAPLGDLERLGLANLAVRPGQLGFLRGLRALQHLDLQGEEGIGDEDLAALAELRDLRSLSLAGRSAIRGPGLEHLRGLARLEELDLSETSVSCPYLAPLAALPLLRLVLREAPLCPEGGLEAGDEKAPPPKSASGLEALAKNRTLAHLDLTGATVRDEHVRHLAGLRSLEVLVLDHTPVSPKCLTAFAKHATLQTVRIAEHRLDRDQAVQYGKTGRLPKAAKKRASALGDLLDGIEAEDAEGPGAGPGGGGLAGLLGALAGDAAAPPPEGRGADDPLAGLGAALLGGGSEDLPGDDGDEGPAGGLGLGGAPEPEADTGGRMLLDKLLEAEKIELVPGASLDDLPPGVDAILNGRGSAFKKAEALTDWLLEQEDVVDDVYYTDEELAKVLEVW